MKFPLLKKLSLGIAAFVLSLSAFSEVIYKFDFSNLIASNNGSTIDPFSITLKYADYVTNMGLKPLDGTPQSTTLGYSVAFAGTHPYGWWAFDDDGAGIFVDEGFYNNGSSFLAMFFFADGPHYITTSGIYDGWFSGNLVTGGMVNGQTTLTVTEISQVPEPAPLVLISLGLAGLVASRKKLFRKNSTNKYVRSASAA